MPDTTELHSQPPAWVQELAAEHDVELFQVGYLYSTPIFACAGDCSCWFIVDDGIFLDRYSFVTEDGWCQGQDCKCHSLPRHKPGSEMTV